MKLFLLMIAGLIGVVPGFGANHYVRQGASGSGSDWNNALAQIPSNKVRGDTYYIADGTYFGHNFSTGGTATTYIKKATIADHGTDVGWQDSYGDGRAEFSGLTFSTSNWVFDGQTGGGPGQWTQGHGFYIYTDGKGIQSLNGSASHITIMHTEIEGHGPDDAAGHNDGIYIIGPSSNWHFSHMYLHDMGRVHMLPASVDNVTIEYSCFARNESTPAQHAEPIAVQGGDNYIIRYNRFVDGHVFQCNKQMVLSRATYHSLDSPGWASWAHLRNQGLCQGQPLLF